MITCTLARAVVITLGCVVPLSLSGVLRANQSAAADRSAREDAGRRHHERLCARCHGDDGLGGELGPPIVGSRCDPTSSLRR